jgi:hypothetical protein
MKKFICTLAVLVLGSLAIVLMLQWLPLWWHQITVCGFIWLGMAIQKIDNVMDHSADLDESHEQTLVFMKALQRIPKKTMVEVFGEKGADAYDVLHEPMEEDHEDH